MVSLLLALALMVKLVGSPSLTVPNEPLGVENVIVGLPPLAFITGKVTFINAMFVGLPLSATLKVTEVAAPGVLGVPETVELNKSNPAGKNQDDIE